MSSQNQTQPQPQPQQQPQSSIILNKPQPGAFIPTQSTTTTTTMTMSPHQYDIEPTNTPPSNDQATITNEQPQAIQQSKSTTTSKKSNNASRRVNPGSKQPQLEIPIGWTRTIESEPSQQQQQQLIVVYTSPSGVQLRSYQEVRAYLLCENTCKCGLQCPLNIYTTFNFNSSFAALSQKSLSDKTRQNAPPINGYIIYIITILSIMKHF